MKIFEDKRYNKINFVDDNNVFVGFDLEDLCCERFGYVITKNKDIDLKKYVGKMRNDISEVNLDDYSFDKSFYEILKKYINDDYDEEIQSATFRLCDKDSNEIFLILYNCHNGYYAHGFHFCNEWITIQKGTL